MPMPPSPRIAIGRYAPKASGRSEGASLPVSRVSLEDSRSPVESRPSASMHFGQGLPASISDPQRGQRAFTVPLPQLYRSNRTDLSLHVTRTRERFSTMARAQPVTIEHPDDGLERRSGGGAQSDERVARRTGVAVPDVLESGVCLHPAERPHPRSIRGSDAGVLRASAGKAFPAGRRSTARAVPVLSLDRREALPRQRVGSRARRQARRAAPSPAHRRAASRDVVRARGRGRHDTGTPLRTTMGALADRPRDDPAAR